MNDQPTPKRKASGLAIWLHWLFMALLLTLCAWLVWLVMVSVTVYWRSWSSAERWLIHVLTTLPPIPVKFLWPVIPEPIWLEAVLKPFQSIITPITQITHLLRLITDLLLARAWAFCQGFDLLLTFNALGFIDGLVQRDLRKYRVARESALLFHRLKALYATLWGVGYFAWLILPWAWRPSVYVFLLALLQAVIVQRCVSMFKKYV